MTHPIYCETCGRKLDPDKAVWLEFNNSTWRYSDPDKVCVWPQDDSLGCYSFGRDCAKKLEMMNLKPEAR